MVFQAFIDDSYKPDGVFVLAGHIAPAESWAKFSKEWEELLPSATLNKYGKYHFKMSEMVQTPDRTERIGPFYRALEATNPLSIACKINIADLKRAQKRIWVLGHTINWTNFSDPFFFTFRALLDWVNEKRELIPGLPNEKIDFIFDDQTQKKAIYESWDGFLSSRTQEARGLYGATPRFEDDTEFLPLQAADLWAWLSRQWFEDGLPMDNRNTLVTSRLLISSRTPDSHKWSFMHYDEDTIVKALQGLLAAQYPNVVIYDDQYKGE
jgi:hypothetical protein